MKHLLWFFCFTAFSSEALFKKNLRPLELEDKFSLVFQSVLDENPENFSKTIKSLTKKELQKITLEKEIGNKNNLLHLMAGVQSYQSYFALQILKLIKQLTFNEADKLFFKRNSEQLSPLGIAEKIKNLAALEVLSKIRTELHKKRPIIIKRNWLKVEILSYHGIGLIFLINGTFLFMTGWEGAGGLFGGLTSFAVTGMTCYATFKNIKKIHKLNKHIQ